jgi:hypothetical protein
MMKTILLTSFFCTLTNFVTAHAGNIYKYTDHQSLSGDYDNRLKQIDNDGPFVFSSIEQVRFTPNVELFISIYPNPNRGYFSFGIQNPDRQPASILLLECAGLLIWEMRFPQCSNS